MDLWGALQVKNATRSPLLAGDYSIPSERLSCWAREKKTIGFLEIRVFNRKLCSHSLIVRAKAKKNNNDSDDNSSSSSSSSPSPFENGDRSRPDGDVSKGKKSYDGSKTNNSSSQKPIRGNLDWREFRASLVAQEQAHKSETETHSSQSDPFQEPKPLAPKWAHPLSIPENGCVLVATEKLDGVRTFERTVVLLLRAGTSHPQEGPFGVIINRPLNKKIRHMQPNNNELATTFSDCFVHFGGPLDASMFLLKTGENKTKLPGFEEVVPGLCFGARNSLDDAAALVKKGVLKPQDFRFFAGYAGWQLDQLREEIESDYWYVASCSSNLICGGSSMMESGNLWEEILQLMGDDYSEVSRKPKQDM
ncbi:unnamed protein product [Linum tenue]|uniref:Uncharacterized protein n=1 Tax=Linum tenue TaxID=586396 RepID=A0AAV0RGT1_9ROSI|nr:unnamed protein product [Linum tenue]